MDMKVCDSSHKKQDVTQGCCGMSMTKNPFLDVCGMSMTKNPFLTCCVTRILRETRNWYRDRFKDSRTAANIFNLGITRRLSVKRFLR
jgi:hypothetical protein